MENDNDIDRSEIRFKIYPFLIFFLSVIIFCVGLPSGALLVKYLISSKSTTEIHGVLVEEQTGKPLASIQIEAEWQESVATPGGGSLIAYKTYRVVTGEKGEFTLPPASKPYPWGIFPFVYSDYGGVSVRVYSIDYTAEEALFKSPYMSRVKITARRYKDANEVLEKLRDVPLDAWIPLIQDFDNKYALSDITDRYELFLLMEWYADAKMFDKVRVVFLELKKREPSRYPRSVDEQIALMKRIHSTSKRGEGNE